MTIDLEALAALGRQMVLATPQAAALGLRFVSVDAGVAVIEAPYRDDLVGDPATGVMAGGVVTTLLDHVCGLAIKAAAVDFSATATLDLRIDYMRPAAPRRGVIGRAHCYRLTRSIAFVRAVAFEENPEDPVATAQGAFVLTGATAPGSAT